MIITKESYIIATDIKKNLNVQNQNHIFKNAFDEYSLPKVFQEIVRHPDVVFDYDGHLKFPDKYNVPKFWIGILEILNLIYYDKIKINDIESKENSSIIQGGFCELYQTSVKWYENLTEFTFDTYYPSILSNIIQKQNPLFNYDVFSKIYVDVLESYKKDTEIFNQLFYKKETLSLYKVWLNYAYGMIGSYRSTIKADINLRSKVINEGRRILKLIQKEFPGHVLYVNTDSIFFKHYHEIEDRLKKHLRRYKHLSYSTREAEGMFIAKLKCVVKYKDSHELKVKGIKRIK